MSARLEQLAERSERDGIPGEATKVIIYNNFLTFFKVQFSFLASTIFLRSFSNSFGLTTLFSLLGK